MENTEFEKWVREQTERLGELRRLICSSGKLELAKLIVESLVRDGFQAELTGGRGLDHGHWVPLHYLLPERNVPVVPATDEVLSFD